MKDSITLTKLTFLLLSLDERCDVKIGDFGLMKDGRNMRLESRNPDEQRGKLSVRWMARESITDSIFTSMTDMVRVYLHSRQKPSRTRNFLTSYFLLKKMDDIHPFYNTTDTDVLDFWSRLPWV